MLAGAALSGCLLAAGVSSAGAAEVAIPTPSATTPAPGAAPAPSAAAPEAAPAPADVPRSAPAVLRIGSTGPLVKDLQRELRRRGLAIAVDGEYGPATKRAVIRIQKRLGLRPTGVARASLLRRLGLRTRLRAADTGPVTPKVTPGASPFLAVFPVAGAHTYTDDFGDARHQGSHEGVDIMADRGTPLLAVAAGTVIRLSRTDTRLGGVSLWLERADGAQYYYAHMTSITDGIAEGTRVDAGEVIGTVGNTGDARFGAPHLHFELHPTGGAAANPYPHLVAVDPTARTQARSPR